MRSSVRIRIALARRPWFVWAAVTLVCGGAALAMNAQVHSAGAERSSWGTTRGVLVATAPVAAGTPWREAAIVTRRLPVAALPTAALEHVDTGVVIVRDLVPGEVLVPADVGDGDRRFALVPAGHVIVAVARPEVLVPLTAGDRVEMVRNDEFRDKDKIRLNRAVFRFIPDSNAIVNALLAGDLDAFPLGVPTENVEQFKKDKRFKVSVGMTEGETIVAINNGKKPFDDLRPVYSSKALGRCLLSSTNRMNRCFVEGHNRTKGRSMPSGGATKRLCRR